MRTGTFVVATVASGLVGGIAGALLFLQFFADSFRPPAETPRVAPAAEPQFTPEEAAALRALPRRIEELAATIEAIRRERAGGPRPSSGPSGAVPGSVESVPGLEETIQQHEKAAIATLRNLCSCQAQIQTSGKIDCDDDGIGEYGTFQEMTGIVGVRKGYSNGTPGASDFSVTGTAVSPAIVAPAFSTVDSEGRATRNGYMFQIFLPDTQTPAKWIHETPGPGLSGGSSQVWVDLSETTWCMYAWPVEPGKTGRRVFFTNQSGDVTQSLNVVARHGGTGSFDPRSAFRGEGITSMIAIGTRGHDGDVWKVTN